MPEQTEEEERQAVLDKAQRRIDQLNELQGVADHLKAGGSSDEPWVKKVLDGEDEDD